MARSGAGTYTLASGNPVVTATTISISWANDTLTDLETAMTDSLSRGGSGGMLAPLRGVVGTVSAPALSWTAEVTSGWYRASAGNIRFTLLGTDVLTVTAAKLDITGVLEVSSGSDLGLTPNVNADELVLSNSGNAGISILTPNTATGAIYFGDPEAVTIGGLIYDHTDDSLAIKVNNSTRIHNTSAGNVGIGTTSPGEKLSVVGDMSVTSGFLNFGAPSELTISSGAITATASNHLVDTEADASTDDLDTISGGSDGDILIIRAIHSDRTIRVVTTGNISLPSTQLLDHIEDTITLIYSAAASKWVGLSELSNT